MGVIGFLNQIGRFFTDDIEFSSHQISSIRSFNAICVLSASLVFTTNTKQSTVRQCDVLLYVRRFGIRWFDDLPLCLDLLSEHLLSPRCVLPDLRLLTFCTIYRSNDHLSPAMPSVRLLSIYRSWPLCSDIVEGFLRNQAISIVTYTTSPWPKAIEMTARGFP